MVGIGEHGVQADIMFVIEGTAINGAYLNDLKTNYLIPTLEFFSQGNIEDRDYVCESTSTLYGLVVYHAADVMPRSSSDCYGPYSSPQRLLTTLDKLELIGGKGESHANIAEGLATALQAFEDLQQKREGTNILTQKHCILVCNSPPYLMPVMESVAYMGNTTDQLAAILNERNINLSILSPRKIPAMFKLFEKAGGDLSQCQNKNYAKDPRHVVLLKGFSLKERPLSPAPSLPIPSLPSPSTNVGSPMTSTQPPGYRPPPQANQGIGPPPSPQQPQTNSIPGRPFPATGPPGYPTGLRPQAPRWSMPPPVQQQRTGFMGPNAGAGQGSALIAQLTQPPSTQFPPHRLEGPPLNQQMSPLQQQQQAQVQQQQQQMRMAGMNMPGQQSMGLMNQNLALGQNAGMNQQGVLGAAGGMMQQNLPVQGQAQGGPPTPGQAMTPGPPGQGGGPQQSQQGQQQPQPGQQSGQVPSLQGPSAGGPPSQQPQGGAPGMPVREYHTIWQGVLEWIEKGKAPNDNQKFTKQVPCQVSATPKEGEPDLKADSWPQKLIMQLMPKQLIGNIGGAYLKNSTSVLFHPQPCEALDSLTRVMSSGFAGCVHFTSIPSPTTCDIKVLILLYTAEKRAYLGFIPNDQVAFVDRLRKVIQAQKNSHALGRQNQVPTSQAGGGGTPPISTDVSANQSGVIMSQTNTLTMGGGQISQPQEGHMGGVQSMGQQNPNAPGQGRGAPMMGGPARPPFNQIEAARQQNLAKIQQLQQTLEAAQQQEMQYKSQLEIISHMKIQQLQQNLEQAQQQEAHFQNQMEMQQMQQRQLAAQQQQQQQSQQGQPQRMVRPQMGGNPGLRHLLQQQQPPFRQQMLGMPQMRSNQPNQQQSFDDVSNFDFMN